MTDIDTSPEAVERYAAACENTEMHITAILIRQLAKEKAELLIERAGLRTRLTIAEDRHENIYNAALQDAAKACEFTLWQPDGAVPDPQFLRGYAEATDDCMNAILALITPKQDKT